ncbi:MAG: TRAP transporter small permease subunit [Acidimicrobiales bacterium]|nr:TRAP transporter small permease subunit [Acidimicrobiales bacterium]
MAQSSSEGSTPSTASNPIDESAAHARAEEILAKSQVHSDAVVVPTPSNPALAVPFLTRKAIDRLAGFTGFLTQVLVVVVLLMVLWSVISRRMDKTFGTSLIVSQFQEGQRMGFAFLTLLGLNFGLREGVNPRVDFWWAEFSNRRKALIDFVFHLFLFLPFAWMVIGVLWNPTRRSVTGNLNGEFDTWKIWETWEQSPDAGGLPVSPIRIMILVGFILLLLQILADIIKNVFVLIGREDLAGIHQHDAPIRVE